jgi:uncharacterized membrane protein YtjA (UPF0391 family)
VDLILKSLVDGVLFSSASRDERQLSKLEGKEIPMLNWALLFLLIALIAAVLGFSGLALAAAGIAKILFAIFLVLFLASLVMHLARRA